MRVYITYTVLFVAKFGSNAIEVRPPSPAVFTTQWMSRNAFGSSAWRVPPEKMRM